MDALFTDNHWSDGFRLINQETENTPGNQIKTNLGQKTSTGALITE